MSLNFLRLRTPYGSDEVTFDQCRAGATQLESLSSVLPGRLHV